MAVRLSKSALENFRRCARCFYLEKVHGIKPPEGIRSGVPKGIERVMLEHWEKWRAEKVVPPELAGKVPGRLYAGERISLKDLRNWRKGLEVQVGKFTLSTALDDLLFDDETKLYSMIDLKTKAKLTNEADTQRYYGVQADVYDLALVANDYPTDGYGYFAYVSPVIVSSALPGPEVGSIIMGWQAQVIRIKADHERAKELTIKAGECLEGAIVPKASEDCENCNFIADRVAKVKQLAPAAA